MRATHNAFRALTILIGCLISPATGLAQTGTIAGAVTDAATGAPPIVSAGDTGLIQVFRSDGAEVARTFPSSGAYSVSVPAGTYFLQTSGPAGYISELHAGIPCIALDCRVTNGTPVTVTGGATTTVDFALRRGGEITGGLPTADGRTWQTGPVVSLYNSSGSLIYSLDPSVIGSAAAFNGRYIFRELPTGTYYILVHPWSGYLSELYGGQRCAEFDIYDVEPPCAVTHSTPILVTEGATTAGIDITLDPGATVTGVVKDEHGEGVWGRKVSVWTDTTDVASAVTSSDGSYTVTGVPPGTYRLRTQGPTSFTNLADQWAGGVCVGCPGTPAPVVLTAGATTTVHFTLSSGGRIAGTLSCCGGHVEIYDAAGRLVNAETYLFSSPPELRAYAYSVGGLADGTYYVRAADRLGEAVLQVVTRQVGGDFLYGGTWCAAEDCDVRRGTPVVVRRGETTSGIDIAMEVAGVIAGTVPALDGWTPEIFDVRGVRLRHRIQQRVGSREFTAYVPAGTYYMRLVPMWWGRMVNVPPILHLGGVACSDCPVTAGQPIVVEAGRTTSVSFTAVAGRAVRGTVRDAEDASPLSTIQVEIVTRSGAFIARDTSDAMGGFLVRSLAPGTYFARTVNTRGYVDEVYDNVVCGACDPSRGTPIVVSADADVTGVDFTLARGTLVTGTITGADLPLSEAGVSLFSSGGALAARARSTVFGEYLAAVPPGTTFARSDPVAGFRQELYQDIACPDGTCDPASGMPIAVGTATVTGIDLTLDACSGMTIAPLRLASAAVGSAYRQTLTASGATPPVVFSIAAGELPPGLTLDSATGVISGTPTTAGRYDVTAAAVDAAGCTATRPYTLDVPACAFVVSGSSASLAATGSGWWIGVSQVCGDWTATSTASWITVVSVDETRVIVNAAPNPDPTPRRAAVLIGPRVFTIYQSGTSATGPFGVFETPVDGATVSGSIAVSGWALDDVGVSRLSIYREPVDGEPPSLVFIGDATFVEGARSDVEAAFPSLPFNRRAGWGYLLLTNMLPNGGNGTFRLHALAQSSFIGGWVSLGTRTINVANAGATRPFGAIDTPAQGATIGGADYINWGWALTPQPQMIPESGSTIRVYIDGVPVGPLTRYDRFRSDVATLFPGLANSDGPVGYRRLDTTSLEEGMHTIAWVATDDGGRAEGIGSRFFHVQNSAWQASAAASTAFLPVATAPAFVMPATVPGVDLERRAASLADLPIDDGTILIRKMEADGWMPLEPNSGGEREITLRELERIEIDLAASATDSCRSTYAGYLVANGELRRLPIGASLDPAAGRLSWQPGAGFVGRYRLLIVRTAGGGAQYRIPLRLTISDQ